MWGDRQVMAGDVSHLGGGVPRVPSMGFHRVGWRMTLVVFVAEAEMIFWDVSDVGVKLKEWETQTKKQIIFSRKFRVN